MKWRRIGTAAVLAWLFAESDSDSASDSSGSDAIGMSLGESASDASSGASSGDGSGDGSGDSPASDSDGASFAESSNRNQQRGHGQPGGTGGLSVGDLQDIPLRGDDNPIKR